MKNGNKKTKKSLFLILPYILIPALVIGGFIFFSQNNGKDKKEYYDVKGKSSTTDEELLKYILNIYVTMCTRGMRGTYLYVCDSKLRKYLSKYLDKYSENDSLVVEGNKVDYSYGVAEESEEYKK